VEIVKLFPVTAPGGTSEEQGMNSTRRGPGASGFDRFCDMLASLVTGAADDFTPLSLRMSELLAGELATPQSRALLLHSWAGAIGHGATLSRGRSQLHNNGFSKVSLCKIAGGWNVRLHVWPAGQADARIHDHRWSFVSIALAGTLDVSNYVAADAGDGQATPRYRLYDAIGNGEKRLERADDATLRPTSFYQVRAGGCHALDFRDPHLVANSTGRQAVTLMLSAPPSRDYSHSYGRRDQAAMLPAPRELSDEEAIAEVRRVAASLGATA
jgi:hypothetical protein